MDIPAGFSGWWCGRCESPCPTIPGDLDAAETKCPHCKHWTAVWVPPAAAAGAVALVKGQPVEGPNSEYERKSVSRERAKEWCEHMRAHVENPAVPVDLSQYNHDKAVE